MELAEFETAEVDVIESLRRLLRGAPRAVILGVNFWFDLSKMLEIWCLNYE